MKRFWLQTLVVLFLVSFTKVETVFAQNDQEILILDELNRFTIFTNENIHGLLIVHRLLELYNQEINKYVDLDSYQLNFYSNADLPENIFQDRDHWFFEVTPYEWYEQLLQNKKKTNFQGKEELFDLGTDLRKITIEINKIRFTVESLIKTEDLEKTENLQKVYDELERGVDLFDLFFKKQLSVERKVKEIYLSLSLSSNLSLSDRTLSESISASNLAFKKILRALRLKRTASFSGLIENTRLQINQLFTQLSSVKSNSKKLQYSIEVVKDKMNASLNSAERFHKTAEVPIEYKLYGKFYFYHNSDIINKMNRYGNGFTSELNTITDQLQTPILKQFEEPHFYQVIYPEKLTIDSSITSSDDHIEIIPEQLKDRNISVNKRSIVSESDRFEIRLYDHMIQDGDRVSINFNGDWILEDYSLEAKAKTMLLQLNKTGKNYLLLHAETIGTRPPNTMAISYYYRGERHEIILKSDLNESEVIEIEVQNSR